MEKIQFIEEEYENIIFVFFKPFNESYYSYAINGLEKFHLIERENIIGFIKCQDFATHERVLWLSNRFFSFLYNFKEKKLIELEVNSSMESIEKIIYEKFNFELRKKIITEENDNFKNSLYHNKLDTLIAKFNKIFKKEDRK